MQPNINAAPQGPEKLSPEIQADTDMFVINGMDIIYDEKAIKSILNRIGTGKDPIQTIAEVFVSIIFKITKSAKAAKKEMSNSVVLSASNYLLGELFQALEAAGMAPLNEEQAVGVWQIAISLYIDQAIKSGDMTQQELTAFGEQIKQTEEGKKILAAEQNPEAAMQGVKKPGSGPGPGIEIPPETAQQMPPTPPVTSDPNALAAPQGRI